MEGISLRDRAIQLDDEGVLVVADLHVGRDEASGVTFPLGERSDLRDRLRALVAHFDPRTVVVAGDVVHTFDGVSAATEADVAELVTICRDGGASPVFLGGNHDTALSAVWSGELRDEFVVDHDSTGRRTVVCHGHESPGTEADRYVIGHDHPAIEIEGVRRPCVLFGEAVYDGADVVVLPAFNRLAPGVLVNDRRHGGFDSPLVRELDAFRPYVWDADAQETLAFPPLGELRRHL